MVNIKLDFMDELFCNWINLDLEKLYYFQETRLFVWKIENFDGLQLP